MKNELKKAIFEYLTENANVFNLVNYTVSEFRAYIFDSDGNFLIGGENVHWFIIDACKLIIKYNN